MSFIDEFKSIKSDKKDLRKFGLTIGIGFIVLSGVLFLIRHRTHALFLWQIPAVSIIIALTFPILLWPFQKFWMALSVVLGFIMTRVILGILFYIIITPIGLLSKLFGSDLLKLKWDPNAETYWNFRKDRLKEKSSYDNQY